MKTLNILLILFAFFSVTAQTKNVYSRQDFPPGWMATGSSGQGMDVTWTIENLNNYKSGSRVTVVLLYNIPSGWLIENVESIHQGTSFASTRWTILNANGYTKGSQVTVISMDNVNQNVWKKIGYDQSSGGRYTLENVGGNNSTSSSDDDGGYIADEDRPKFIPYTPNTPAQIAAHNAKVAKDREKAWLAGQSNFYFYSTNPNKEFIVFVYQLHPLNQTSFHNDQRTGSIVQPSFIASAMDLNKLVLSRPIEKYFVKEPTMMDAQNPAMIWVKLENRFKYNIYVVSKGENIWDGWEVSTPRNNSNRLFNVNMTNPKPFPPPPPIAPSQKIIKKGYLNALLRIWDVQIANLYIKNIGSPSSEKPIDLGELLSSYGEPRINIMKGNITSNFKTKELMIPVGKYILVAIDKNNSRERFERQIEIFENQHTYIDVDFDYSYLYSQLRFDLNNEPKDWKVSISIDNNSWKERYIGTRGYSYYDFCSENKKFRIVPDEIMKPNVDHTMRVKYVKRNGEVVQAEKKFTFGKNECIQVDFIFGVIDPNANSPSEGYDLPPPPNRRWK